MGDIVMVPHRYATVSAAGQLVGESSPMCRYPDSVVAEARRLRTLGRTYKSISIELGVGHSTVRHWVHFRKRPTPTALVLKPIT